MRRLGTPVAVLLLVAFTAAGCTSPRQWVANGFKVGPNYCAPSAPVADDWIDADDKRVVYDTVDHAAWWGTFNDPVLNDLVSQAYRQNLSLREAGARITESRALRAIAVGNAFPQQQSFSSSYSHNLSTGSGPNRHFSSWRGSFNLAWEIDFWGRYRRAIEAADADLDASVFDYGDVVVTLVADVASTYIDYRTVQRRLELVRENVENQLKTFEITERRLEFGEISDIDYQQAKSSLAQTQALVPQLELALRQTQNQLCVLLGIPPVDLAERLGAGTIPTVEPNVVLGIPAQTLTRRPDVRRAERLLARQSALIGVAESDLYPQITLSGTVGRSASQFKDLFNPGSGFGSVGPSLNWDLLNYGRILGNIRVQDARFCQLLAAYRQTVLLANLEAENAVAQFLKSQERLELQLVAAEAAAITNDKIILSLNEGEVDYNRVFNVQNSKRQQDESSAAAKGDVAQSLIAIYRALGGGWPSPFLGEPLLTENEIDDPLAQPLDQPLNPAAPLEPTDDGALVLPLDGVTPLEGAEPTEIGTDPPLGDRLLSPEAMQTPAALSTP